MGFSTCSMVVDDVHFHLFLFSSWLNVIECDCFDDIEWVRMNGSCLLNDETEFDNLFFLFFSAMMKTIKEWNLIRFVFHFADFADCYQFSQNEFNRHSFWIVIWESMILIKLVEMIEISTAIAKNVLILFCFVSSFWFEDCRKGEMWKEIWNLLARNNWWNSRKKERKEKCDISHLSNWMKLPRDWIGWMIEIGCNQTMASDEKSSPSQNWKKW